MIDRLESGKKRREKFLKDLSRGSIADGKGKRLEINGYFWRDTWTKVSRLTASVVCSFFSNRTRRQRETRDRDHNIKHVKTSFSTLH